MLIVGRRGVQPNDPEAGNHLGLRGLRPRSYLTRSRANSRVRSQPPSRYSLLGSSAVGVEAHARPMLEASREAFFKKVAEGGPLTSGTTPNR